MTQRKKATPYEQESNTRKRNRRLAFSDEELATLKPLTELLMTDNTNAIAFLIKNYTQVAVDRLKGITQPEVRYISQHVETPVISEPQVESEASSALDF